MKISLCMIARNESLNIVNALRSIIDVVDEVILVDDESEDDTVEVALTLGPKLRILKSGITQRPAYPDIQKNVAISAATGDIIFVLDCDEVIEADLRNQVPYLAEILMTNKYDSFGFVRKTYIGGVFQNPFDFDVQIRMWRVGKGIHSSEKLHEGIVGYKNSCHCNLIIYHYKTAAMQIEDNQLYDALGYFK